MGMQFDICLVLRRQGVDVSACIAAILGTSHRPKECFIYISSVPECMQTLLEVRQKYAEDFAGFAVFENEEYTKGISEAVNAGNAENILLLNAALNVEADFFMALEAEMKMRPDISVFECRQLPIEQDDPVHPASLELSVLHLDAFVVRRKAWENANGLDLALPPACAGIDFGWRLRGAGEKAVYAPKVCAFWQSMHQRPAEEEFSRYIGWFKGHALLLAKYGTFANRRKGYKLFRNEIKKPRHFENVRKELLKNYIHSYFAVIPKLLWQLTHRQLAKKIREYLPIMHIQGRGYAPLRLRVCHGPLISVVVRTASRPEVLKGALQSLCNQTYANFETIVIEDGPETSREICESFAQLKTRYISTGMRIGRGRAGNVGLLMSEGEYVNFLDDDDYFYPDHLEMLVAKAIENSEADLVLGCAMAAEVNEDANIEKLYPMLFDRIDEFTMSQMCQIPIQTVLFKHTLYENYGGLSEDLEANEDWHMWLRFLAHAKRITKGKTDVVRATSVFVVPASETAKNKRLEKYKKYNENFYNDENLQFTVSLAQMRAYYDGIIADMQHLAARGELEEFLEKQAKRDEY